MQPFRFRTAAQASAEAATADEALAHAQSPAHEYETRLRLYAGIAARPDLSRHHVETLLENFYERASTVLTALWANPIVSSDPELSQAVLSHIGRDDIFAFALAPNAEALLPRLLAICANPFHPEKAHLEFLADTFTSDQVAAAIDVLVEELGQSLDAAVGNRSPLSSILQSTLLEQPHLTRLVELVEHAVADAETPLPSGRSRRKNADYEARIHRMSTAQDVIATLLTRKDLTEAQCLSLVQSAEKIVADAAAFTAPTQRDWARASATHRMMRNAVLTPNAMSYAFTSDMLRVSFKDINLNGPGVNAALLATVENPRPILVQQALGSYFSLTEQVMESLLSQVRTLEDRYRMETGEGRGEDEGDLAAWGNHDEARWGTSGARSDQSEQQILDGLIRTGYRHIGKPVWDAVYDYVLTHPRHTDVPHAQVVDYVVATAARSANSWMDDSATPTMHAFAVWASASNDAHLRRHAVAQCWEVGQLHDAAQDPSPLVRIEVLKHDLATTDEVLAAARDIDPDVRLAAAEHAHIDSRVISVLSNDPDERVRTAIARRVLDSLQA
jgi:hypothetical protein